MRKILLFSEIFPPQHGGSGRWFWEVYRRFPKKSVTCFVGNHPQSDQTDRDFPHPIVRGTLTSREWGIRSWTGLRFYLRTWKNLVKIVKKESVKQVHCGRVLPEGFAALLVKFTHRIPYTCYVHGEDVETALTSRELKFMTRLVMDHAECIVANSQNSKSILTDKWELSDNRVIVMTPGVDIEKFNVDSSSSRPKHWIGKKVVLTVGRLQKRKGQDMMIRALPAIAEAFPDIHYCIIGDGDERVALGNLALSLGVSDKVEFAGELEDAETVERYRHCDLFALPNRRVGNDDEGFGMVLLEAQACGRPVLAGKAGGTGETMRENETGLRADCTDPGKLASIVINLFETPEEIDRLAAQTRKFVVSRFSWTELASQTKAHFGIDQDKVD